MRKIIWIAGAAALLAALLLPSPKAAAKGWGGHHHFHHHGMYGLVFPEAPPAVVVPVIVQSTPAAPRVFTCRYNQETVTVQAEGGGERQIRITRC